MTRTIYSKLTFKTMIPKTLRALVLFFLTGGVAGVLHAQNDHYPQFMEMGNRALGGEKYDLAIDYYQSALDDKPDCWQAYVGLGNCYYYQKKLKESLKAYEKALQLNPGNTELIKFIQFLRAKLAVGAQPTPTPTRPLQVLPGLPALPPPK